VTLTPFGQDVLGRLREVLRIVDEIEDSARAARDWLSGAVRMGVIPTVAPYVLPRIVARLTARYPGLDLHLRETVTSRLIGELAEGSLDAAILALPVGETAFEEVPLFTETFVLVRPGADRGRRCPAPNVYAKCGSCCWRKGIASATRPCRFATWRPTPRGR
jgi:LysR family hydrogen peroxide-inducible transcriptional activator